MRALFLAPLAILAACGGSTSPASNGNGGGDAASACSLPDGTYTERFILGTMGLGCPNLDDVTFTIPGAAPGIANPFGQLEGADAGAICNVTHDTTCTTYATCMSTVGGYREIITAEIGVRGDFVSGTLTIDTDDPRSPVHCMWNTTTKG